MPERTCSIDGCEKPHMARGWCATHYSGWQRTGHPLGSLRRPLREKFWDKVDMRGPEECWEWTGATDRGYGVTWNGSRTMGAHRYAYLDMVGVLPEGMQLDHLCRNRSCVNPKHLEPVVQRENLLRGEAPTMRAHRDDMCVRGLHPLVGDNVYVTPGGRRRCVACVNERRRKGVSV